MKFIKFQKGDCDDVTMELSLLSKNLIFSNEKLFHFHVHKSGAWMTLALYEIEYMR